MKGASSLPSCRPLGTQHAPASLPHRGASILDVRQLQGDARRFSHSHRSTTTCAAGVVPLIVPQLRTVPANVFGSRFTIAGGVPTNGPHRTGCRCVGDIASAEAEEAAPVKETAVAVDSGELEQMAQAQQEYLQEMQALLEWLHANGHYAADPMVEKDVVADDKGAVKRAVLSVCRESPQYIAAVDPEMVRAVVEAGVVCEDERKVRSAYQRLGAALSEGRPLDISRGADAGLQDTMRVLLALRTAEVEQLQQRAPGVFAHATPLLQRILTVLQDPPSDLPPPPPPAEPRAGREEDAEGRGRVREQREDGGRVRHRGPPPRDGDWLCTECGQSNFARNGDCFSCEAPRSPDAQVYREDFPSRGGGRDDRRGGREGPPPKDGDWKCTECEANNFASRQDCFSCHAPRSADAEVFRKAAREGDWTCTACEASNFAARTECYKCHEPKSESAFVHRGAVRPGDWTCTECATSNFASRRECYKCSAPRTADASVQPGAAPRDGDWLCPDCGADNFASRMQCFKCATPRPEGAQVFRDQSAKSDGWGCTECGRINFPFRTECFKCGAEHAEGAPVFKGDRSGGDHGGRGAPARGGERRSDFQQRGGERGGDRRGGNNDWTCGCGELNFGFRRHCRQCGDPAPAGAAVGAAAGGGGRQAQSYRGDRGGGGMQRDSRGAGNQQREGDWNCPQCGASNFSFRTQCFRCKDFKPDPNAGDARWYDGGSADN